MYRFAKGEGLSGHNFGNLLLTALTDLLGDEEKAIEAASRILRVRGRVIPVTTDNVHLWAEYDDGERVVGEHDIDAPPPERSERRITNLGVTPAAALSDAAAEVLKQAELVILGPGDLYTGILANGVVSGFAESLAGSQAKLVYVANLMSRTGQTIGMTARDYVTELERYLGRAPDVVITNTAPLPEHLVARYAAEGNHPVTHDCLTGLCPVVSDDLLARAQVKTVAGDMVERSLIRHDSDALASVVMKLLR